MSRISKNIIYNVLGQGTVLILGFLAVKFIFRDLGADVLGIVYFTLLVNSVLVAIMDMGISTIVVREVSGHLKEEPGYVRDLIRTASSVYWLGYGFLAVLVFLAAPALIRHWIIVKSLDLETATRLLQILAIAALTVFPQSLYTSLFRGLERMEINNSIDVGMNALQQLGTIVILYAGGSLFHVIYWFALCFGLALLTSMVTAARLYSWESLIPGFSMRVIRRNLGTSFHMMSISVLAMIHMQADKVILSRLLPVSALGYYGVAFSAVSKATLVRGAIAQAILPSFSVFYKKGDHETMIRQFRKLQDFSSFGMLPLFAAIPFAALPLFSFVFNREAGLMLVLPLTFLSIGFYMNGMLNVPYIFSIAANMPQISSKANFLALFIVPPLTVVLVHYFGLAGAAFSWVVYHVFAFSYTVPRIYSECLRLPVRDWTVYLVKSGGLIAATYGLAGLGLYWMGAFTVKALLLAYIVASVTFLLGASRLIGNELRETLSSLTGKCNSGPAEAA